MPETTRIVSSGNAERSVRLNDGSTLRVPDSWELLPPGDAALTRRVKKAGPTWTVQEKKGRRTFSKGIWADAVAIARIRHELEAERSTDAYAKRRTADKNRRDKQQTAYVGDFHESVFQFLAFDDKHTETAKVIATLVAEHATPVGSGTVARTKRIPIEQRAEAAVIAWMRHQTTAYDNMVIPRIKGKRRETRRMLAQQSKRLLQKYRTGEEIEPNCPLQSALANR